MIYHKQCPSCGDGFTTHNPNIKTCKDWDCTRLALIKRNPRIVFQVRSLEALAHQNGIYVDLTPTGAQIVDMPDDDNAQWRKDKDKIVQRAYINGRHIRFVRGDHFTLWEYAWNRTAKVAAKRAASRYPSKRQEILKRKGDNYIGLDGGLLE